ncbi:DUF167 domain-containing protein [Patescibacteria group bacterium]|nr:DUF167 domain-containing protein [Patescibacteria group bacterium]
MANIEFEKYINDKIDESRQNDEKHFYLRIKVLPKSVKNEVVDIMDDETIKIRIKAVPEKGKANKELVNFLSKEMSLIFRDRAGCVQCQPTVKCNVEIISGKTDQVKLIKITYET